MKKNILITGGLGYIGSHVATMLLQQGHHVVVVDLSTDANTKTKKNIEFITGQPLKFYDFSIYDAYLMHRVFKQEKIDTVIHLAGSGSARESVLNPSKYYDSVFLMSRSLLRVMTADRVKNLIFASGSSVYGAWDKSPLTEDVETYPNTPFGSYKKAVENAIQHFAEIGQLNAISLRLFHVAGAHESGLIGENLQNPTGSIFKYLGQALASPEKTFQIFGSEHATPDGTAMRDFVHVEDVANAIAKAVEKVDETTYQAINICSGEPVSVLQIFNTFNNVSGNTMKYVFDKANKDEVVVAYGSNQKAKQFLDWQPTHNLNDMCSSYINYLTNQKKHGKVSTKE